MYRLVCFNKDGSFHHLEILETLEGAIRKREKWAIMINVKVDNLRFPNIYKCNSKGNNYSNREIWV